MRPSTERIRVELTLGALTMRELATRCGVRHTYTIWPYVWQMQKRTREVVRVGRRFKLRRQHTELSRVWA